MAHAQPQRKPTRLGLLSYYCRSEPEALQGMQPFLTGMRERGYVLGEHFSSTFASPAATPGACRHLRMN